MARDFAKVSAPSKSDKQRDERSLLPVIGIVVIAALCFAAGFWLGGNQDRSSATEKVSPSEVKELRKALEEKNSGHALLQAEIDRLQEQLEQWKRKAGASAHSKVGELQFYHELPEQSVTPAPVPDSKPAEARAMDRTLDVEAPTGVADASQNSSADQVDEKSVRYRVQLASFKTRNEAASMQSKLMKKGVTAFIHAVNLPDRGEWFRVYAGPFDSKEAAKASIRDIQDKMKIRGLLIRDG